MKTPLRTIACALFAALATSFPAFADDERKASPGSPEVLENAEGVKTPGRLEGEPVKGFRFTPVGSDQSFPLRPGMTVFHEGRGPSQAVGVPPFSLELGLGQRISGRLASIDAREVRLLDVGGESALTFARGGVHAVVQRAGEAQVFQDSFETLDSSRWTVVGEPELSVDHKIAGGRGLRLPAGGASLTHRLEEPFGSGRLEVAFEDGAAVAAGQQWFVDLTFRGSSGRETIRVVLGWAEDSLAVESPGGPALAVQRLARKSGWHRLTVKFGPKVSEVAVNDNELAHGRGVSGPLTEVRLASYSLGKAGESDPPAGLTGYLDDLRLVRFSEPVGGLETDVTQDEVRETAGDQLFGKILGANSQAVALNVDGHDVSLPWGEISGLYFRRAAAAGAPVEGLLVRVDWRASSGTDPRDLNTIEGALTGLSTTVLNVETPYCGVLSIPRDRMTSIRVLGRGRRIVLDSMAHHLGDEISTMPPILDPPQPEGGVMERSVDLDKVPEGSAFLVLEVVQVVGEAPDLPFSSLIKKGELRTNVKVNGEPFDYLNHYISSKNETPERIRLPIPAGLLRKGKNVVRLEQTGKSDDANYLDDLGILSMALEFAPAPAAPNSP